MLTTHQLIFLLFFSNTVSFSPFLMYLWETGGDEDMVTWLMKKPLHAHDQMYALIQSGTILSFITNGLCWVPR